MLGVSQCVYVSFSCVYIFSPVKFVCFLSSHRPYHSPKTITKCTSPKATLKIFQRFVSNQLLQTSHLMIKTMKSTLSFEGSANLTIHSTCKAFTFITWIGGDIAKREKNMLFKNIPQTSTECVCVWQRVRALLSNRWCNFFCVFHVCRVEITSWANIVTGYLCFLFILAMKTNIWCWFQNRITSERGGFFF